MEKSKLTEPKLEIIEFEADDIIATSNLLPDLELFGETKDILPEIELPEETKNKLPEIDITS